MTAPPRRRRYVQRQHYAYERTATKMDMEIVVEDGDQNVVQRSLVPLTGEARAIVEKAEGNGAPVPLLDVTIAFVSREEIGTLTLRR